ncbi:MAG TPA: hypothetical protein VFE08_14480 [Candidatus Sulfotelmatobacter sp.]|nr:hypothetical protein [Candidatus Sulfotelmatobacter sp.]
MHRWFRAGSGGQWVHHSSEPESRGNVTDSKGVSQDIIGPMSARMARKVADALNEAYRLGAQDEFDRIADAHERMNAARKREATDNGTH